MFLIKIYIIKFKKETYRKDKHKLHHDGGGNLFALGTQLSPAGRRRLVFVGLLVGPGSIVGTVGVGAIDELDLELPCFPYAGYVAFSLAWFFCPTHPPRQVRRPIACKVDKLSLDKAEEAGTASSCIFLQQTALASMMWHWRLSDLCAPLMLCDGPLRTLRMSRRAWLASKLTRWVRTVHVYPYRTGIQLGRRSTQVIKYDLIHPGQRVLVRPAS